MGIINSYILKMKLRKSRGNTFGRTNVDFRSLHKSSRFDKRFGVSRLNYLSRPNNSKTGRSFFAEKFTATQPEPYKST